MLRLEGLVRLLQARSMRVCGGHGDDHQVHYSLNDTVWYNSKKNKRGNLQVQFSIILQLLKRILYMSQTFFTFVK